jgi:[glutamine synthetase] adenylyltransferase / [glutamine synthetase]-adenylyl-L-tyrosine phosphorylase
VVYVPIAPSDLFLSADLSVEEACRYLAGFGLRDPAAADTRLQALADDLPVREALAAVAGALLEAVQEAPDPDAALLAFARHVEVTPAKTTLLRYLHEDPRGLGILVAVTGPSPLIEAVLTRNPEYLHWLVREIDRSPPDAMDLAAEADELLVVHDDDDVRLDALKRFQRREFLRTASRDLLGRETIEWVSGQLSALADVIIERVLRIVSEEACRDGDLEQPPGRFVVIGRGRLAGRELSYDSRVELFCAYERDEGGAAAGQWFERLARSLVSALNAASSEGVLFDADHCAPLLPSHTAAMLPGQVRVCTTSRRDTGSLARARAVAGDLAWGDQVLESLRALLPDGELSDEALSALFREIAELEGCRGDVTRAAARGAQVIEHAIDVVEVVPGMDREHVGTRARLAALEMTGLPGADIVPQLARSYERLRMVEHSVQLATDISSDDAAVGHTGLALVARRLGLEDGNRLQQEIESLCVEVGRGCRRLLEHARRT